MEIGSFTSEPQYQRPDQRNSDIDYVRRPEPIVTPVAPVVVPTPVIPAPITEYGWDPTFARRLFDKMGREYINCNRLNFYGNAICKKSHIIIVASFHECGASHSNQYVFSPSLKI